MLGLDVRGQDFSSLRDVGRGGVCIFVEHGSAMGAKSYLEWTTVETILGKTEKAFSKRSCAK